MGNDCISDGCGVHIFLQADPGRGRCRLHHSKSLNNCREVGLIHKSEALAEVEKGGYKNRAVGLKTRQA